MVESSETGVADCAPPGLSGGPVDGVTSGDGLAAVLARRWRTMAMVSLVACVATVPPAWFVTHPKYEVAATVHVAPFVRPILFSDYETDISRQYREYLATVANTVVSPAVIDLALVAPEVRSIPWVGESVDPVTEIATRIAAEHIKGTQLLRISMVGKDRNEMVLIINSVVASYLHRQEDGLREWDEKILGSLRIEQSTLQSKLEAKVVQIRELASDTTLGFGEESVLMLDMWGTELQKLLADAGRRREVAKAKLAALGSEADADAGINVDRAGFESYLAQDGELQILNEQLRAIELSALYDHRDGRGPEHPDTLVRPQLIAAFQERVDERRATLREAYATSVGRSLRAEVLDAQIAETVFTEELKRLASETSAVALHRFQRADLEHERERLELALSQVRQKIWNVEVEQNRVARVTIDSPARGPRLPNVDKRMKYSLAALVFSLMMGASTALLRDRLDTSVLRPVDVPARLGMHLLGSVGSVAGPTGAELTFDERIARPMRGICAAMLAAHPEKEIRTRLVTSPTQGNGKTSLAINLARTMASAGKRVLLVDGDNDGQAITRRFYLSGRPGLMELIDGTYSAGDTVHGNRLAQIRVLPAGRHDDRFGELLTSMKAQAELRNLFESYDEVIVDSPPVLGSSDTVVLATLVDGVVLVLRAGQSTRNEAEAARFHLEAVGSRIIGVILNDVDPRLAASGYSSRTSARRSEPTSVQQRRGASRISTTQLEASIVECQEAGTDRISCPLDATRFVGHFADLSRDGMGLVVENGTAPRIQTGTECFVVFNLPEDSEIFVLLAEVRDIRQIWVGDTEAKLLGMKFVDAPEVNCAADMERLACFVSRSIGDNNSG